MPLDKTRVAELEAALDDEQLSDVRFGRSHKEMCAGRNVSLISPTRCYDPLGSGSYGAVLCDRRRRPSTGSGEGSGRGA